MEGLEEIGKRGYEKQLWGAYEEAITIYTSAIRKYPNDPRLYNNRCLCYVELKDYKKAMEDAENMILLFSKSKKAYFRKGEILAKLKKFEEAEVFFRQVLNLDPKCEDARIQAREAQVSLICKGLRYNREQATQALNYTGNVQDARTALINGSLERHMKELEDIYYISDDEDASQIIVNSQREYDPLQDPSNPYRSPSLWVGSITKAVTEQFLTNLFSKHGKVKSVRIVVDSMSGYAFVNFFDSDGPGKAMKHLQGHLVDGQKIVIKYPDNVKIAASVRNPRFKYKI